MSTKTPASQKVVTDMPPTLLVGLGGTGCAIVGMAYERASKGQKKNIQFAFLDTDANELRERKLKAPMAHTVQTSRRITVGQALRDDPEALNNTFPINPQLMNKPLTEGAGQIRAVSKLAFDMCVREGRLKGLHEAINKLQMLDSDDMEQSIRVLIVSTLVGGTGSGILLPVSLYLRNYLENYCNKKPIIRAFCLLPDIFFTDPNKHEIEKANLRTNAYATLRELDAFMLRADSAPGSEIRSRFTLKMPRPGTVDQYDEYEQNPLDYCFLFDAQNINGETLNDLEEYKKHAAECIYVSSISRLHERLNSSEDNTILERCAQQGRNRYCGVGVSRLYYPSKKVVEYIALNWMKQAMTEDWLRYDDMVAREVENRQNSRRNGTSQPAVDKKVLYCNSVADDITGEGRNYLGVTINEETSEIGPDGFPTGIKRWDAYFAALHEYILSVSENSVDDSELSDAIQDCLKSLEAKKGKNFASQFNSIVNKARSLFNVTKRQADNTGSISADSRFSIDRFNPEDKTRLEHYLMIDNVPIHPNSARYFLYKVKEMFEEEKRLLSLVDCPDEYVLLGEDDEQYKPLPIVVKNINDFFTKPVHPGPNGKEITLDEVTTVYRKNEGWFGNSEFFDKTIGITKGFTDVLENIKHYFKASIRLKIVEKALAFIEDLCDNYEQFYKELGDEIKQIDRRIQRLEKSFPNRPGKAVVHVCASPECLKMLLENCPNTVDSIKLTKEFKQKIFDAIYLNSTANPRKDRRQQQVQLIKSIISKDIFKFWVDSVNTEYGDKVNMNIVQALMKEAEYLEGYTDLDDVLRYVEGKKKEAEELAAPFIDKPVGQPYEIFAYGLHPSVQDEDDTFVSSILEIFPGYKKDGEMGADELLVMKALYNLKACDLKKFAASDPHIADPRADGSYFRDYVNRIDNILPDSAQSNIITPHLDRRWHFVGVLPDFEDKTEVLRKNDAQKAFLIAFAYEYVRFDRDRYKFLDGSKDFINEQIVVGDGLCDKLHEVYEALSISRPLVRDFLARFNTSTAEEKHENGLSNRDFTCSKLYNKLNTLHLKKFDWIANVSFLELPLLFKASVGHGGFKDDDAVAMLRNFVDLIENYLKVFYPDNIQRNGYLVQWLGEQTELLLKNVEKEYNREDEEKGIYIIIQDPRSDELLRRLMTNILGYFERFYAFEAFEKYDDMWKVFIREMTQEEADERAKKREEKKAGKKADGE